MTERTCGECTACCTNLGVQEIQKPEFEQCRHVCERGCAIYPERPSACMGYECLWLLDAEIVDTDDRPDKLGVIFSPSTSDFFGNHIQVSEVWSGAATDGATGDRVRMYVGAMGKSLPVLLIEKGRRTLIDGPEAIRDKLHLALLERDKRHLHVLSRPDSAHGRSHNEHDDA